MRKISIPALAAAISLAVFACSESPTSSSEGSSSSENPSSSSKGLLSGNACEYSGEKFGLSGLFICEEAPSNTPSLQECVDEGGVFVNACPKGEKVKCIDDDDDNVLYKIYAKGFTCGDLELKNLDGSKDIVPKGGACGPFAPYGKNVPLSLCIEFPELSTSMIKFSCASEEIPFVDKCPSNADLVCYDQENEAITYLYGGAVSSSTCESFGMEELQ